MSSAFVNESIHIALARTHLTLPIVFLTISRAPLYASLLYLFAPRHYQPSNEPPATEGHWYTLRTRQSAIKKADYNGQP